MSFYLISHIWKNQNFIEQRYPANTDQQENRTTLLQKLPAAPICEQAQTLREQNQTSTSGPIIIQTIDTQLTPAGLLYNKAVFDPPSTAKNTVQYWVFQKHLAFNSSLDTFLNDSNELFFSVEPPRMDDSISLIPQMVHSCPPS